MYQAEVEACRAFDGCFSMSVARSVEVDVMALAEASTLRRDSASCPLRHVTIKQPHLAGWQLRTVNADATLAYDHQLLCHMA